MPANLSEEQRLMRQSCRDFVDDVILPFIRGNWQREWSMTPEHRLPPSILEGAEKVGIRTLGVPEEFGVLGEGYMRVSYANSTENILKALDRMGEFLTSRKAA